MKENGLQMSNLIAKSRNKLLGNALGKSRGVLLTWVKKPVNSFSHKQTRLNVVSISSISQFPILFILALCKYSKVYAKSNNKFAKEPVLAIASVKQSIVSVASVSDFIKKIKAKFINITVPKDVNSSVSFNCDSFNVVKVNKLFNQTYSFSKILLMFALCPISSPNLLAMQNQRSHNNEKNAYKCNSIRRVAGSGS